MEYEISIEQRSTGLKELDNYSKDFKIKILSEAFLGKKDLATILAENCISEEIFYLWKILYT